MALYSSCPFVYEDSEWELQTFVREDMLIDGGLAMDDSGHFLIQAISGEDSYVFLDETIQLGVPEADVWEDDQNIFHERYGFQRYDNYSAMVRKHFF